MPYRLALSMIVLVLADFPGAAQIGGQYPGGGGIGYPGSGGIGYPGGGGIGGIQLPGTTRRRNGQSNVPSDTLTGKLQRISTSQFVLEPDDGRLITVSIDRNTRYVNTSGGAARFGDFDTGDQVSIDASHDNQNYYHALRVTLVQKAGTPDQTTSSQSDDSDRPKLKRSAGSSETGKTASAAPSDTPKDDDPDRPRLKRTPASADTARPTPTAQITDGDSTAPAQTASSKPVPREADDPGPPVLRRGAPARVDRTPPAGSEPQTVATARPSIRAEDSNGITRPPAPPVIGPAQEARSQAGNLPGNVPPGPRSGDPVIQGAREAAWSFTETLPNYVVKQFTTRYQTDSTHGNRTQWQALDVVTADVVCENGKESYKNILVNGKAPRDSVEKSGSWSTGEFATVLQGILAPQTDADFHSKRSTTIVNRAAFRYDYSVEQPNSQWQVHASAEQYIPGYTGSIWIDKENNRVLRIEMSAKNMPRAFPLDQVESAVDYDYVLIGDQKFLLPVHSEALSCVRGTSECTRNVIDFRNYKKFGADTSIKFETDKD